MTSEVRFGGRRTGAELGKRRVVCTGPTHSHSLTGSEWVEGRFSPKPQLHPELLTATHAGYRLGWRVKCRQPQPKHTPLNNSNSGPADNAIRADRCVSTSQPKEVLPDVFLSLCK